MPITTAAGNCVQMQDGTAPSQGKQKANGHVPNWHEVKASISEGVSVFFQLYGLKGTLVKAGIGKPKTIIVTINHSW